MLKCLGKLTSTRMSIFQTSQLKASFIDILFEGISTLMTVNSPSLDIEYFIEILELNFRIIVSMLWIDLCVTSLFVQANFGVKAMFERQLLFGSWVKNLIEF